MLNDGERGIIRKTLCVYIYKVSDPYGQIGREIC